MKKAVSIILIFVIMLCFAACSSDDKPTGLLADEEFVECMKNTFAEIDIDIDLKDCTIIEDYEPRPDISHDNSLYYRGVKIQTIHNDVEMKYNCFYTLERWNPVFISDLDSDMFYWVAESNRNDYDVYDWKTGEIIPNSTTNNDFDIKQNIEQKEFEQTTRLNVIYDENNYSQLILTLKDDETSIIGVCVFDGTDLRNEALRSLAFTVYCLENANTFCEGNLLMTYKTGEITGFANYTNGECTLSDFPDTWNEYASEITQTEIEDEIQNIIDNIS